MPNLQVIRAGIASLPNGPPLVVAVVGGTTGIGSYVVRALAKTFAKHGSKLRVYIVGRKASRAEPLITYGHQTSPGSDFRFIQASDLSLLSEVDRVSQETITQEEASPFAGGPARLDALYMSHALSPLQPSNRTSLIAPTKAAHINVCNSHKRRPRHPNVPPLLLAHPLHPAPDPTTNRRASDRPRDIHFRRQHGRNDQARDIVTHWHSATQKLQHQHRTRVHKLYENIRI
jgi:hypothetical protein